MGAPSPLRRALFPTQHPNDCQKTTQAGGDAHRPPGAEHQRHQQPQKATIYSDRTTSDDDNDDAASSFAPPPPLLPPPPSSTTTRRPPPSLFTVFFLSAAMAACSGLGALPYLFFAKPLPDKFRGFAAAAACGVMLAVSFDLIHEGEKAGRSRGGNDNDASTSGWFPTTAGVVFGALFIRAAQGWLAEHETVKWASLGGRRRSSGTGESFAFSPSRPEKRSKKRAGGGDIALLNSLSLSLSLSLPLSFSNLTSLFNQGNSTSGTEAAAATAGGEREASAEALLRAPTLSLPPTTVLAPLCLLPPRKGTSARTSCSSPSWQRMPWARAPASASRSPARGAGLAAC